MTPTKYSSEICSKCGSPRRVSILWGYSTLTYEEIEDIRAHRALLGLNRRYFRRLERDTPAPELLLEQTCLPREVCLDCQPRWSDLHRLTLKQWEVEAMKTAACDAWNFEQAAALLHHQQEIEKEQGAEILALLRELAQQAAISL